MAKTEPKSNSVAHYFILYVSMVVLLSLTPRTRAAPAMPPPHWAKTYMMQRSGETKRVKSRPIVTAGFAWPPDT